MTLIEAVKGMGFGIIRRKSNPEIFYNNPNTNFLHMCNKNGFLISTGIKTKDILSEDWEIIHEEEQ